ncbi:MAG: peptidylprolyl isomerase [Bacteroidales bacterium]|nr:peptidylprolyl isomerase [Bacteroidales bacterium]
MRKISFLFALMIFSAMAFAQSTKVLIETSKGNITVMLYDETPLHRDNFIKLVEGNFYDSILFHRVINNFMIQAGVPTSKNAAPDVLLGDSDTDYTIPAEFDYPKYYHKKGALAAARTGDDENPERRSSGSQFYIVQGRTFTDEKLDKYEAHLGIKMPAEIREYYKTIGGTPHLDTQYTVFGEVVEGMDVVNAIAAVETNKDDRPLVDVRILKMKIIKDDYGKKAKKSKKK